MRILHHRLLLLLASVPGLLCAQSAAVPYNPNTGNLSANLTLGPARVITLSGGSIANLTISTANITAPGNSTTLLSSAFGNVTIGANLTLSNGTLSASGGGDAFQERGIDNLYLRDDFFGGHAVSGGFGMLGWKTSGTGNVTGYLPTVPGVESYGLAVLNSASSANSERLLYLQGVDAGAMATFSMSANPYKVEWIAWPTSGNISAFGGFFISSVTTGGPYFFCDTTPTGSGNWTVGFNAANTDTGVPVGTTPLYFLLERTASSGNATWAIRSTSGGANLANGTVTSNYTAGQHFGFAVNAKATGSVKTLYVDVWALWMGIGR